MAGLERVQASRAEGEEFGSQPSQANDIQFIDLTLLTGIIRIGQGLVSSVSG